MITRTLGTAARTAAFVAVFLVAVSASPAGAHGIDITATFEGTSGPILASLELTDETGEVCLATDAEIRPAADLSIETLAGVEVVVLGSDFGPTERCQFLDVDSVNAVLADVDAHRLTVLDPETGEAASGQLAKPAAPVAVSTESDSTESETVDADSSGLNVPLIFGIGAGLGVAIAVIRNRRR